MPINIKSSGFCFDYPHSFEVVLYETVVPWTMNRQTFYKRAYKARLELTVQKPVI